MRRLLSVVLVIALLSAYISVMAEENNEKGVLEAIGGFLGDVASDASDAFNNAVDGTGQFLSDTGNAIGSKLDDAGNTIGSFLDSTGVSIEGFWRDATGFANDAWNWAGGFIKDEGNAISTYAAQALGDLESWLNITGDNGLSMLQDVFEVVATNLGIAGDKAAELWNAIYDYSVEKNINMVVLVKLALAIMIRISLGGDMLVGEMAGNYIDEIVMQWFYDFDINNEADAEDALRELEKSLEFAQQEN